MLFSERRALSQKGSVIETHFFSLCFQGICDFQRSIALNLHRYVAPITSVLRAASTTSSVMTVSSLISKIRSICTNNLWSNRKFPLVMRLMAAIACVSVKSALSRDKPSWRQWRVSTKVSSSPCSARNDARSRHDCRAEDSAPCVCRCPACQ